MMRIIKYPKSSAREEEQRRERADGCPTAAPRPMEKELEMQLQEVMFGLRGASDVSGPPASVTVTTLEGNALIVQMDGGGVRIVSGGGEKDGLVCDCLNSLLLNASPGFVARFNESLCAQLRLVADEQSREEAAEAADG